MLWQVVEGAHFIVIATFGFALFRINAGEGDRHRGEHQLIAHNNTFNHALIKAMSLAHRRLMKCMRSNPPNSHPLALLIASGTRPKPSAMYVQTPRYARRASSRNDRSG